MKKRIIITGIDGFIGSALYCYLCDEYDIIGIDRKNKNDFTENFYHQDINDKLPDIRDIFAVIHLAANPGVRDSHEKFEQVCKDNILGTQRIIDKCISSWKPKKLLLASSSSVYGDLGSDGHALKETDGVSPRSPYAMSKVANENLMRTYKNCGMLDGIDVACLRFFTVYGPHQRNELAIRAFTDWILRDEPIILYGTGEQVRDFTHIDDICSGIKALLDMEIPFSRDDIYNIGSGETISINQIIRMISTYLEKNVTIDYQQRNRYDVIRTKASIERMRYHTCWKPKIKFEDGLKQQIEWQKTLIE